ncbi:MAG: UDP-N-acetylmuramoyl-L-alanine--D-glutamate ligase [Acidobacteria bacterium]|nr:UDP-N-acetylmuramoyl-L-alanine--D-glutamate ligase [Acidobacteriota bacterium]
MTVLVIGLAVSGKAALELLREQGERVVAYDRRPEATVGIDADEVYTGDWDPSFLGGVDLVVPSPGVPETSQVMADVLSSGVPVWSELELGYRRLGGIPLAAITGTNGKTTVTELAAAMLVESGVDAAAVGNIGDPITGRGVADHDVLVVEASSFQLRFIDSFRPSAAVIVNFAPDHLDWHPDVAAYGAAKSRIFEHMEDDDLLVFDAADPGAVGLVASAVARRVGVTGHERQGGSGPEGPTMYLAGATVSLDDLKRTDSVMLVDLAAAAETARALGATAEGIAAAAVAYQPGRHRREVVARVGGVTFIDDSKATNPHAALAAIGAYPSVVLIAGGRAKGLDIRPLARADSVRGLVAIGESAEELLSERRDAVGAATMGEAVDRAISLSDPGDVVLLAPGCASFDMFDSYGHRGDVFAAAVREKVGA